MSAHNFRHVANIGLSRDFTQERDIYNNVRVCVCVRSRDEYNGFD